MFQWPLHRTSHRSCINDWWIHFNRNEAACIANGSKPSRLSHKIYDMHELSVFLTTVRAYGIYDNEYQVIASDWITMKMSARPPFFSCKITTKTTKKEKKIKLKTKNVDVINLGKRYRLAVVYDVRWDWVGQKIDITTIAATSVNTNDTITIIVAM